MKYGFNLLLWTSSVDDDTRGVCEDIKGWGYDGVELPIFDLETAPYEQVGRDLKDLELGCSAVTICTPEENPIGETKAIRQAGLDRLKKALDCCAAAGATHLVGPIHSALGDFEQAPRSEEQWARAKDVLGQAADHAQQVGVMLTVEYLNRFECFFLNCAEDAARFCREVDHPSLKMMYDTFHANIEEKSIAEAIRECADQTVHVHISENDRSTPGTGHVHWDETFDTLAETGYLGTDNWLTIEAFGLALPDLAAATRIWRRMYDSEERLAVEGLKFMQAHVNKRQG